MRTERNPDYDSVVIHYRFLPTGAVGQMVTVQGRKDAQEYIDACTANDPRYEFWLVPLPADNPFSGIGEGVHA